MSNVRCDEFEKHEEEWIGVKTKPKVAQHPCCCFDVSCEMEKKEDVYKVNISYFAIIKDGEREVVRYKAPYTLTYSLEKYNKHGETEILASALNETKIGGFSQCLQLVEIFMYSRVIVKDVILS